MWLLYCGKCGKQIPDEAVFCAYCGQPTQCNQTSSNAGTQQSNNFSVALDKANGYARCLVPTKLALRFRSVPPLAFVTAYILIAVIVITTACGIIGAAQHDLSGTYRSNDFFPVNSITFEKNGEFTAMTSEGDILYGKYNKDLGGEYSLEFTDGKSSSGNAVTQYSVSASGKLFALSAKKVNDSQLKVEVIPKIGYWAWLGTISNFYK